MWNCLWAPIRTQIPIYHWLAPISSFCSLQGFILLLLLIYSLDFLADRIKSEGDLQYKATKILGPIGFLPIFCLKFLKRYIQAGLFLLPQKVSGLGELLVVTEMSVLSFMRRKVKKLTRWCNGHEKMKSIL